MFGGVYPDVSWSLFLVCTEVCSKCEVKLVPNVSWS